MVGGATTDPFRLRWHTSDATRMSGRLEYVLSKNSDTKVLYIGAQSGPHEFLLASGFIFDW
jgi:hypothetical protein